MRSGIPNIPYPPLLPRFFSALLRFLRLPRLRDFSISAAPTDIWLPPYIIQYSQTDDQLVAPMTLTLTDVSYLAPI